MRKSNKNNNQNNNISPETVRELLAQAGGQDLFGRDGFFHQLKVSLANGMLEGEMEHHLGYEKHDKSAKPFENRRNGHYEKSVITGEETLELQVPRDRDGGFEPRLVPKGVRRFAGFDDKVISMYARGMTMREIQEHLYEIYGTDVSPDLISSVTEKVLEEVNAWQNRPLDELYPIIFLDCIHVKTRDNHMVANKAVYLALAVNMEGQKEVLGLWISKNEGAKFWMQVVTELKNRGVQDVFIACVDGLKGFEEAINAVFPQTTVQLCIVHMVRNSLKFVPWKDRKAVAADLKSIYSAPSEAAALLELEAFRQKWDHKYPTIADIWQRNWTGIAPCLAFPEFIKKAIYTTNAIEAINRQIRKIIKNKGVFPNDDAVKKSIFLALKNAQKKWTMPIHNWPLALNQFAILFADRIKF
jgi:putative transposase